MKKALSIMLALGLVALVGCDESTPAGGVTPNEAWADGTYEVTVDGQEGPMTVETVVEAGIIKSVTLVSHNETAGIADPALEQIPMSIVGTNSATVDLVAGATLTSNRIMGAVEDCLTLASGGELVEEVVTFAPFAADGVADGTYTGTAKGFGGDVTVEATVAGGMVTALVVTGDGETAGIGTMAIDAAHTGVLDGVAGATVTMDAINAALESAFSGTSGDMSGDMVVAPVFTPFAADGVADGMYTGTAQGFGGEVSVEATVAGGMVTALVVTADAETPGIGTMAVDAAHTGILDGVAGATVTMTAINEAIDAALAGDVAEGDTEGEIVEEEPTSGFAAFAAPADVADGDYTAEAQGFGGAVKVEFTVSGGMVTALTATGDAETPGIGTNALDAANAGNVDGVAGATVTMDAINEAIASVATVEAPVEEPVVEEPVVEEPVVEEPAGSGLADGTYTASSAGFAGDVSVTIVVAGGEVTSISAEGAGETPGIGTNALDAANAGDISVVAGATVTSNAIQAAYDAAVAQAAG